MASFDVVQVAVLVLDELERLVHHVAHVGQRLLHRVGHVAGSVAQEAEHIPHDAGVGRCLHVLDGAGLGSDAHGMGDHLAVSGHVTARLGHRYGQAGCSFQFRRGAECGGDVAREGLDLGVGGTGGDWCERGLRREGVSHSVDLDS